MTNLEILECLKQCDYTDNYIAMCFIFAGESYKKWFIEEINTNPEYGYLCNEVNEDMVNKFMESLNDEECNLKEYFKMKSVLQRADLYMAKRSRIKAYSKIMEIDISSAAMLYLEYPRQCEDDMWDKVYKETLGEDYKEKYWHEKSKPKACYIDKTTGKVINIKDTRESKMYYLYGVGALYNYQNAK